MVPGGTFNRGNNAAYPATISPFRLDNYEVTVSRFRKFVAAYSQTMIPSGAGKNPNNASDTGWNTAWNALLPADAAALTGTGGVKCDPMYQNWTDSPGGYEKHPINCVNWYVAFAFCIWDGGRLPTEAEWNFAAAGGSEQRVYPWSTPPSSTTINCSLSNHEEDCGDDTVRVGTLSPQGDARWGHSEMAGNVAEWVLDYYTFVYPTPCEDCAHLLLSGSRVDRGGAYFWEAPDATTYARDNEGPTDRDEGVGMRCARAP